MVPSAPFSFPSLLMRIKTNILKVQVKVTLRYLDSLAATFPIITCAQSQNREQHAKNFTPETEGKIKVISVSITGYQVPCRITLVIYRGCLVLGAPRHVVS